MAGSGKLEWLLMDELTQLREEGRAFDREEWVKELQACGNDKEKLMAVYEKMQTIPMREDYPYDEPSELAEIKAASKVGDLPEEKFAPVELTYFHGAWLGRCIGCAWGQPCEGWAMPKIRKWYKEAGKYPVSYFFPAQSGENRKDHFSTDENICGMGLDDDTRFTVLNYLLLKDKGYGMDAFDVGDMWSRKLPYRFVFTAESQAYLNFINCDDVTPWSKPENADEVMRNARTATYLNPYREWIGAQIRADAFAYVCAGMPVKASELAFVDASFSHVKNGIYGEMFFAAMIAAAFTHKDVEECFDIAMATVPVGCRFAEEMKWAKKLAQSDISREELMDTLFETGKKYNWVHTINNATFCVAAIMRYPADFREAVAFAVECGMDTDCNGATVGSFMGALLGREGIPADLADAMKDTFTVGVPPYDNYSIEAFAAEVKTLHEKLNG